MTSFGVGVHVFLVCPPIPELVAVLSALFNVITRPVMSKLISDVVIYILHKQCPVPPQIPPSLFRKGFVNTPLIHMQSSSPYSWMCNFSLNFCDQVCIFYCISEKMHKLSSLLLLYIFEETTMHSVSFEWLLFHNLLNNVRISEYSRKYNDH